MRENVSSSLEEIIKAKAVWCALITDRECRVP